MHISVSCTVALLIIISIKKWSLACYCIFLSLAKALCMHFCGGQTTDSSYIRCMRRQDPAVCREFARICEPYNDEELQWHPVTPSMSKTSFQGPECCKPLKRKSIATFFKPKAAPGAIFGTVAVAHKLWYPDSHAHIHQESLRGELLCRLQSIKFNT